MNGDSVPDLVVMRFNPGEFFVLPGLGGGAFGEPVPVQLSPLSSPTFFVIADFDVDGKPDIAFTDDGLVSTLLNQWK